MSKSIGIIGFGNMGSAFYEGVKSTLGESDFFVFDHNADRLSLLPKADRAESLRVAGQADIVILAVKPQSFNDLASSMEWNKDSLIISIMAGISIKKIKEALGLKKVVRCMPNLPVKIKKGLIGWCSAEEIEEENKNAVQQIFSSMGQQIELENESMMDSLTLIAGCGPGYFYYFADLLAQKAKTLGFSDDQAERMAKETFLGSALLFSSESRSSNEMQQAVASKGGVTEAALKYWKDNDLEALFNEGIEAAKKKAEELNR